MEWIIGLLIFGGLFSVKNKAVEVVQEHIDNWKKYDALFKAAGSQYDVDWTWLKAIALNESNLGLEATVARGLEMPSDIEGSKSSDGKSWGLMQVTLTTAHDFDKSVTVEKLNDAAYSIDLGAQILSKYSDYFSLADTRYMELVVKSYNEGPGNALKEFNGQISGYSEEYWNRFQRNLERVKNNL